MTYGWKHLSDDQQRQFAHECVLRMKYHKQFTKDGFVDEKKTILIVGDMPGPGAPQTDDFHHTPFYAKNNCSGWLNAQLIVNNILEDKLLWINAADWKGVPTDASKIPFKQFSYVVALGGNAEKWAKKNAPAEKIVKFHHPQYQKRFKSKEPYRLIAFLKSALQGEYDG